MLASGINSLVKAELLCLFYDNPSTVDTAHGLALRLGREEATVAGECEELVGARYLRAVGIGRTRSFSLAGDRSRLTVCARIRRLLRDKNLRLVFIARLVKQGGSKSRP